METVEDPLACRRTGRLLPSAGAPSLKIQGNPDYGGPMKPHSHTASLRALTLTTPCLCIPSSLGLPG